MPQEPQRSERPRILVIGAGFGGLACARELEGVAADVLLVDRNNYHLFTPLLYQVASSLLNPSDIAYPIRMIFRGSNNVRFRQAEVESIDPAAKRCTTASGQTIAYDHLVVASGSRTNFFGNAELERRALGLKTIGQALQLRNHILTCLEEASVEDDRHAQQRRLTFVIVGGGPTGVEYAGALAELLRLVLRKEYPGIEASPRIVLVEGAPRVLGMFSEKLSRYTEERLERLGVEVLTHRLVKGWQDGQVLLSNDERIAAETLVWTAGVKPSELADLEAMPHRERSDRVEVDEHLRIAGWENAFAIGDIAAVRQDGIELPQISPPAMQAGRYVARRLRAELSARTAPNKPEPFRYVDKGTMATIGRNAAVCSFAGLQLTGWLGWLLWLIVHIYYLIGFRNRLVVLWSWCWNYIWYDRPVRIITRARPSK